MDIKVIIVSALLATFISGAVSPAIYMLSGRKPLQGFLSGLIFGLIGGVVLGLILTPLMTVRSDVSPMAGIIAGVLGGAIAIVVQYFISKAPYEGEGVNFARQQEAWGWIFLSPWLFGFLAFVAFPMVASLVFSFLDFNLIHPDETKFIGFANFVQLTTDPRVVESIVVTLRYALIALPLALILPVTLAALMNSELLIGKRFYRTMFYMPYMVLVVSSVFIWGGVLNSETGWLNRFLEYIGLAGPDWLNSTVWIYPALNIIGLWGIGNAMLYTLAAMQGVPTELYEAAKVDGASGFSRFRNVTIPMISPVIFYNLILAVVGLWRYFDIPYILKDGSGDPGGATYFINMHLYKTVFAFHDMGYGAAISWLLFVLAFGTTLAVFATRRYWVYYAAEE